MNWEQELPNLKIYTHEKDVESLFHNISVIHTVIHREFTVLYG